MSISGDFWKAFFVFGTILWNCLPEEVSMFSGSKEFICWRCSCWWMNFISCFCRQIELLSGTLWLTHLHTDSHNAHPVAQQLAYRGRCGGSPSYPRTLWRLAGWRSISWNSAPPPLIHSQENIKNTHMLTPPHRFIYQETFKRVNLFSHFHRNSAILNQRKLWANYVF